MNSLMDVIKRPVVTEKGVTLITPAMLGQPLQQLH